MTPLPAGLAFQDALARMAPGAPPSYGHLEGWTILIGAVALTAALAYLGPAAVRRFRTAFASDEPAESARSADAAQLIRTERAPTGAADPAGAGRAIRGTEESLRSSVREIEEARELGNDASRRRWMTTLRSQ